MLEFWRLDTKDGDFVLVRSPSFADAPLIRQYHLELLTRARSILDVHLPEYDIPLFAKLRNYYSPIAALMGFEVDNIASESRHTFFIAAEPREDLWISGLELLMGYDFVSAENPQMPLVTSGSYEIDLLAEICLCIPPGLIEFLLKNKSQAYLSKLVNQISQRTEGAEGIKKAQQKKDLEMMESLSEEMEKAGWQV